MYRNILLFSFHNSKVEYCAISGSGDIEENASVFFFTQTLYTVNVKKNMKTGVFNDLQTRDGNLRQPKITLIL